MDFALLGSFVAVVLTFLIYSFLYKENKFYRFAEYSFIGVASGYWLMIAITNLQSVAWGPILKGNYSYVIPLILGVALFARLSKGYSWLARWPVAIVVGTGTALALRGFVDAMFIGQIRATIAVPMNFDNILIAVITACSLFFFMFTMEHKGPVGIVAKIGRYGLMVYFGVLFGNHVMTRMALLTSRFIEIQKFILKVLGLG